MSLFANLKATPRDEADIEASRIRVKKDERGTGADKRKVRKAFLESMPTSIYALRDAAEIASGKDTNNVYAAGYFDGRASVCAFHFWAESGAWRSARPDR